MAKKQQSKPEELLYLGLGIASLTAKKLDELTDYLVKESKLAKNKKELKRKLRNMGKQQYDGLMQDMESSVNMAVKSVLLGVERASAPSKQKQSRKKKASGKKKK